MPSRIKDVARFFEEFAVLKEKVKSLEIWHKWEMALLAAILIKAFWVK